MQIDIDGCALQPKTVELIPDWKKADINGFALALDNVDWASLLADLDTEQSWELEFVPSRIWC